MPTAKPFVIGRQTETERFARLVSGQVPYWLLNIYGPGGIGKTIVGQKMQTYAQR